MGGKRILIADDDPVILRLLEVNLELEDYEVLSASDGDEAYQIAVAEVPDLIILDIMMPRQNGYETCQKLKANAATKDIPIIFLSAKAQQSDVEYGKTFGVHEYLTKPFEPSKLNEVVERLTVTI